MMFVVVLCGVVTIAYAGLMLIYSYGWSKQKDFILQQNYEASTLISIVIPARNEAANIANCIDSILEQRYPPELFEIIIVDDHSTDNTAAIVHAYAEGNVHYLSLADHIDSDRVMNSYKKAALAAGIAYSKGPLIVTTDADCTMPNTWLTHIAAKYEQEHPVMIVAPVIFTTNSTAVQLFQLIDFMSMQGITAAAHALRMGNMSNGANLAFTKAAYQSVNGYQGIDALASGDDYLLMVKLNKQYPGRIAYLKSPFATVRTLPQPTWHSFLQQRIRWASKSGKYNDGKLTAILLLVYLFNCALFAAWLAAPFSDAWLSVASAMLTIKIVTELLFLFPVAHFFRRRWELRYFLPLQPLHVIYIVTAGFLGFVGKYQWKGRTVK
jgi:glycosyltransferase involved in cell wall biosynthesis